MLSSGSIVRRSGEPYAKKRCRERQRTDAVHAKNSFHSAGGGRRVGTARSFSIRAQQRASPSTRPVSDEHVLRASTRRPKRTSKPPSSCFQTHAAAFMGSRYISSTWAARRGQQNWLHDIRNVGIVCCGGRRLLRFGAERGTEQEQFVARRCSASAAIGRLPHECAMRASAEATCSHTAFYA